MGLMGYDGHCTLKIAEAERETLSRKANTLLADTASYVRNAGLRVEIVSGAGTFTYRFASEIKGLTEIQAGTYLLMDTAFQEHGVREFNCALTVLTTVISRPGYAGAGGLAIVDTGRKSISPALGLPEVKSPGEAKVISLSDEHGRVILEHEAETVRVGDKLELWVRDANGTINQFDRFYAMRGETVEDIWKIPLGGSHT
jgi:D-serine deaminase-like pyridoxal phosphate-dependent protein